MPKQKIKVGDIVKLRNMSDDVRPGALTAMRFYRNLESILLNKIA